VLRELATRATMRHARSAIPRRLAQPVIPRDVAVARLAAFPDKCNGPQATLKSTGKFVVPDHESRILTIPSTT
jgi:hypothetical protein